MKISVLNILAFAFGLFLGAILFKEFQCNKPTVQHVPDSPKAVHDTTKSVKYVHDTIPHLINTSHDDTCWLVHTDSFRLPANLHECDSLLRIAEMERKYKRSFNDKNVSITVRSQIRGTLDSEQINYLLLKPTTIITQTITPAPAQQNKIFISGFLSGNQHGLYSFGPQLELLTKQDKLFGLGYDLLNRAPTISIGIKIHLKK